MEIRNKFKYKQKIDEDGHFSNYIKLNGILYINLRHEVSNFNIFFVPFSWPVTCIFWHRVCPFTFQFKEYLVICAFVGKTFTDH